MFSTGQWVFAALFLVAFVIIMIFSYRKDIATHRKFYKGSYKVLIAFFLFIAMLFVINIFFKR
jgi:cytochrome bd-type quinol oxidase subunit 1